MGTVATEFRRVSEARKGCEWKEGVCVSDINVEDV